MKKILSFLTVLAIVVGLTSCEEKIKTTRGVVKRLTEKELIATIDKYEINFDITKAKVDNGALMAGDSVVVHYTGDLREKQARALLLRLIPKQGTIVEAVYDPSKELIVKKDTSKARKERIEKFLKAAKKK